MNKFEDNKSLHKQIHIDSIDSFQPIRNNVLLKRLTDNVNATTEAGIYKVAPSMNKNEYLYQNADRMFEVVRVPYQLHIHPTIANCPLWVCDMELQVGDIVWVWGRAPLYCPQIVVGDDIYDMISYFELIVALRKANYVHWSKLRSDYIKKGEFLYRVIPLNGYVLMEELYEEKTVLGYSKVFKREDLGRVAYLGNANKRYWQYDKINKKYYTIDRESGIELKHGDVVVLGSIRGERAQPKLEDDLFQYFNGKTYFALQRQYMDAILIN